MSETKKYGEALREAAIHLDSDGAEEIADACRETAAEIDRLAARVRELEEKLGERAMDWQREYQANPPPYR